MHVYTCCVSSLCKFHPFSDAAVAATAITLIQTTDRASRQASSVLKMAAAMRRSIYSSAVVEDGKVEFAGASN
jgi:hypothetical protein